MSEWVRIASWHIVRTWTRVPGRAVTLCGRTAESSAHDAPPADERTCEACFRIRERAS